MERLRVLARSGPQAPVPGAAANQPLIYQLFVNEVGEIVSLRQLRGVRLASLEAELQRMRVVTPGRRGPEPVPMAVAVEIPIE